MTKHSRQRKSAKQLFFPSRFCFPIRFCVLCYLSLINTNVDKEHKKCVKSNVKEAVVEGKEAKTTSETKINAT